MDEPIDGLYFNWLCAKVLPREAPNYIGLMRILYNTEFVWVVSGDKNRAEDGLELRLYFLRETHLDKDEAWYYSPCSVLEALIAFSQRASFQTDTPAYDWFWVFIDNLGLHDYRRVSKTDESKINDILNRFLYRTYDQKGDGGLFPMRRPNYDQREVEIWYQFYEYLEDQGLV